jgi:hypothetical protein
MSCSPWRKERSEDLQFIGGDFNNQPFGAFGRAKE